MRPAILVHGGAWATPEGELDAHRIGVHRASMIGFEMLLTGSSALDAVQKVVEFLEADPTFNAGRGAVLNARGEVELDAAIMEGSELKAGSVAAVSGVLHPVVLAREVLEHSQHVMLAGEGAREFARHRGVPLCDPEELVVERERERFQRARRDPRSSSSAPSETVGAVACDSRGQVAAASSTGGTFLKLPGRIGDSPIVGAGLYADDRKGAAASTGRGETILRMVMAYRAVAAMTTGIGPAEAAQQTIRALESRTGGQGGIILVDAKGELGYAFNTPHMAYAYLADGMTKPEVGV
ncbi:MAG TPA: isoaspartyl peptidase/L-asparaginase family protein [Vicinamibacteria bacterium]|nr:isoaspartyl peptidase/L-asparaginase family protein [Vicinamibacteria bacterium]